MCNPGYLRNKTLVNPVAIHPVAPCTPTQKKSQHTTAIGGWRIAKRKSAFKMKLKFFIILAKNMLHAKRKTKVESQSRQPKHAKLKCKMSRRDKLKRRSGNGRMKVLQWPRQGSGVFQVPSPTNFLKANDTKLNKTHFLSGKKFICRSLDKNIQLQWLWQWGVRGCYPPP